MTVAILKEECIRRGLGCEGNKNDLKERLLLDITANDNGVEPDYHCGIPIEQTFEPGVLYRLDTELAEDIEDGLFNFGNDLSDAEKQVLLAHGVPDHRHRDSCLNGDACKSNDVVGDGGDSVSLFKCFYCFNVECARCSRVYPLE